MALIPAGSFVMGDFMGDQTNGLFFDEFPLHTNYISAFYIDKYEVTKALWNEVLTYDGGNGYTDLSAGTGRAANHPTVNVK